jgi:PhnB protein
MSKVNLDPYLFFGGNAKEAMDFYKGIFGGELTVQTISEAPDFPGKESMKQDNVMHAMLDGDVRLMASDSDKASPGSAKVELSLSGEDEPTLRKYWERLSEDAEKINQELEKAPWGDTFGMLRDRYGVDWMVNITTPKD